MDIVTLALCKKYIKQLTDGAPEALDTLKEVADWIEQNNKQADFAQLDSTAVDFIKNKPIYILEKKSNTLLCPLSIKIEDK